MEAFGGSYASASFLLSPVFAAIRAMGVSLQDYGLLYSDDLIITNMVFGGLFFTAIALMVLGWSMRVNLPNVSAFCSIVVLLSPFYFCITKECVLFALTAGVLASHYAGWLGKRTTYAVYVLVLVLCGIYFRVYYIVFAMVLGLHLLLWQRKKWLLLTYALGAIATVVLHDKLPLDLLNKGRASYLEESSASRIHYYFDDTSGLGFLSNRALTLVTLLFPVNLLLISISYAPFVLLQLWLTWKTLKQCLQREKGAKTMAAAAVLGFTIVGALFEPDFGSYFRHKVNVLPFLLLLVVDFKRVDRFDRSMMRYA
jgi:hypothetical protein